MRRGLALLLVLTGLAGCDGARVSTPEMRSIPDWSNVGTENVTTILRLIDQLCVRRSANSKALASGLKASGWEWQQVQQADPNQPLSLDLWKSKTLQILRGNLGGEEITNCTISVEGASAPDPKLVARRLANLTKQPAQMGREWWWRSSPSTQTHIELMDSAFEDKAGITVVVENYKLPWWRSVLGI